MILEIMGSDTTAQEYMWVRVRKHITFAGMQMIRRHDASTRAQFQMSDVPIAARTKAEAQ
jgi:hypothetical protein